MRILFLKPKEIKTAYIGLKIEIKQIPITAIENSYKYLLSKIILYIVIEDINNKVINKY